VQSYVDDAVGTMVEDAQGGRFMRIVLRPRVVIRAGDNAELAAKLHHGAHAHCYIANSVNFPIDCEPVIESAAA
jgi:organic hydroperoxide reductase OsmC/OhrA